MSIRILPLLESCSSEIAKQSLAGVWDLKVGYSEMAMKTEWLFKKVWDFKPVRVDFWSHVNVL